MGGKDLAYGRPELRGSSREKMEKSETLISFLKDDSFTSMIRSVTKLPLCSALPWKRVHRLSCHQQPTATLASGLANEVQMNVCNHTLSHLDYIV